MIGNQSRVLVTAALAALWLTACGGGGGGDTVAATPTPAPAPAPGPAPSPAPTPAPAPGATAVQVVADTQLAANTSYEINSPVAGTITVTLPPTAGSTAADTVSIAGVSANAFKVAQNAGQSILTTGMNGNVAVGTNYTARNGTPKVYHWLTSNPTGEILLAGEAAQGLLNTSTDGGATWTTGNSVPAVWISSDMSADGGRMVAVQYNMGGMYQSTDKGRTWTQITSPSLATAAGALTANWESVTISEDGLHIAAVIQNGRLVISNDGGTTWTAATMPGTPQNFAWRSIDSSFDGKVIVAVSQDSRIFKSTNGDAAVPLFTEITVDIGTAATPNVKFENWYRVKMSRDGQTIAVVANTFGGAPGTGIYVSRNGGTSWVRGNPPLTIDYTALAVSADGMTIAATASTTTSGTGTATVTNPGRVLLSTDGGTSFTAITPQGAQADAAGNWRAVALSADGNKMALAAGNFLVPSGTGTAGQLYTSQGNRTSIGSNGFLTGGQNDRVTLEYVANGQWKVKTSAGGPFSIK